MRAPAANMSGAAMRSSASMDRTGWGRWWRGRAVEAIAARAKTTGIAVAAIANNNHIGMLAWYAEAIAQAGQVAIILTTSEALVHPFGGRTALLGTNPIAIGAPTDTGPFVIDLATSLVSMGEIHDHAHRGAALQSGWAVDADGNPTTNANAAKGGAIAPFGGAKGYALGLAFELLVTALTGAALGRGVTGTLNAEPDLQQGRCVHRHRSAFGAGGGAVGLSRCAAQHAAG